MQFCPTCGNILLIDGSKQHSHVNRLFCRTCPYHIQVNKMIKRRISFAKDTVDDVIFEKGGEDTQATTEARCERCGHKKAFFKQMQTRSADEPPTEFYKCVKCGFQWKEG